MKEVIERLNWLAYKCEDKAITPDVKDDVKYALEEIERLNNIINELERILQLEVLKTRENSEYNKGLTNAFNYAIHMISELKESDSNENL